MNILIKAAVASLLVTQAAASYAQAGAAGAEESRDRSRENVAGGIVVGGILIAVAAVAATGGNDGLRDTSTPVVSPIQTTPSTTTTSTRTTPTSTSTNANR